MMGCDSDMKVLGQSCRQAEGKDRPDYHGTDFGNCDGGELKYFLGSSNIP